MDIEINVPPLRERTADILPLVDTFIQEFNKYGGHFIRLTSAALTRLEQATWPGNIRQLRSAVRTAMALATDDKLDTKDFPYNFFTASAEEQPTSAPCPEVDTTNPTEFVQSFLSVWKTLSEETQQSIACEILNHIPETGHNSPISDLQKVDEGSEFLKIKGMDQKQILCTVAQKRIAEYGSVKQAADSLGIDVRTLQRHAHWHAENDDYS